MTKKYFQEPTLRLLCVGDDVIATSMGHTNQQVGEGEYAPTHVSPEFVN